MDESASDDPHADARTRDARERVRRVQRIQRAMAILGMATIAASASILWVSYRTSRAALIESLSEANLNHSMAFAERLDLSRGAELDAAALEDLVERYHRSPGRKEGSYLCVTDRHGTLRLNTGAPEAVGRPLGLEPFRGEGPDAPATLQDLIREGRGWVGRYRSLQGEEQMAAFAFVPRYQALVAVHVPWRSVQAEVNRSTLPWAIALAVLALVIGPLCLWGLHKTYLATEREAQLALEAERQAVERMTILREIDRAMLSGGPLERTVSAALEHVRELVGALRTSVVLVEGEAGSGRVIQASSTEHTKIGRSLTLRIADMGIGDLELLGRGQANVVEDLTEERATSDLLRALRSEGIRSYANVPMVFQDRFLGTLNLGFGRPGALHAEEIRHAREVADLLAVAVVQDQLMTRLERHAEELERRVDERTSQLSEVNQELQNYVHSVSHDLQSPLRAIHGFGNLLLDEAGPGLGTEQRGHLRRMISAAARMDLLMRDLLAYSRIGREQPELEPVDAAAAVEDARQQLAAELEERGAELHVEPGMPRILAHPPMLRQALANLIGNAAKFVAPGVRPVVRIRAFRQGAAVRIEVEDNGIGIDPKHHQSVFGVFQRLHGVGTYPGTGIGLAIVRRAVERMGGRVGVESAPGKGSKFWIELRAAGRAEEVA